MRSVSTTELKRIRDCIFNWLDNPDCLEPNSAEIATLCNAVYSGNFSAIELFNLPATASQSDIRNIYKKYIVKTHPDKVFHAEKMCLYIELTGLFNVAWEKTSGKFDPKQAAPATEPATAAAATSFAAEMGDTVSASWEEIPCFTKIGDYSELPHPHADHQFKSETNKFIEALANIKSPQDFAQWIYAQRGVFPGPIANTRGASLDPIMEFLTKAANRRFFATWKGYYLLTAMKPIMSQIFSGAEKDMIEYEFLAKNSFREGAYGATDALVFFLKMNRGLFKLEKIKNDRRILSGFLEKFSSKKEILQDLNENFIPISEIFNEFSTVVELFKFCEETSLGILSLKAEDILYVYKTYIHENFMNKIHQEKGTFFNSSCPPIFNFLEIFSLKSLRSSEFLIDDALYNLMLTQLSDLFPVEFQITLPASSMVVSAAAAAADAGQSSNALTLYSAASSRTPDFFDWFAKKLFLIRKDDYGDWPRQATDCVWQRFLDALPQERHRQIFLKLIAAAAKALNNYCNYKYPEPYPGLLRPLYFAYTIFNPSHIERQVGRQLGRQVACLSAICNSSQFNLNDVQNIIAEIERLDKEAVRRDEMSILKKVCKFMIVSRPTQTVYAIPGKPSESDEPCETYFEHMALK